MNPGRGGSSWICKDPRHPSIKIKTYLIQRGSGTEPSSEKAQPSGQPRTQPEGLVPGTKPGRTPCTGGGNGDLCSKRASGNVVHKQSQESFELLEPSNYPHLFLGNSCFPCTDLGRRSQREKECAASGMLGLRHLWRASQAFISLTFTSGPCDKCAGPSFTERDCDGTLPQNSNSEGGSFEP